MNSTHTAPYDRDDEVGPTYGQVTLLGLTVHVPAVQQAPTLHALWPVQLTVQSVPPHVTRSAHVSWLRQPMPVVPVAVLVTSPEQALLAAHATVQSVPAQDTLP